MNGRRPPKVAPRAGRGRRRDGRGPLKRRATRADTFDAPREDDP